MEKIPFLCPITQCMMQLAWFLWVAWWTATVLSFSPSCHNVRTSSQRRRGRRGRRGRRRSYHDWSAGRTRETQTRRCGGQEILSTLGDEQSFSANVVDPETLRSVTFCNLPKDQGTIMALLFFLLDQATHCWYLYTHS
jgi:hypothetical protein